MRAAPGNGTPRRPSTRTIHAISAHAEGAVGDVTVGGVLPPHGETPWQQSRRIARDQTLRTFVLNEPRGPAGVPNNRLTGPPFARSIAGMFGFRDIEIIRAIARHGGFRAASDATGLAQSAISRRVRHLESRMKIAIFERDGRGVRLTAAGRRFCDEAEVLMSMRERILGELTQGVMAGVVRLGVSETVTHTLLPRMLTGLSQRHPLLRFEISVDTSQQMGQALMNDELDVVIMLRDQAPRGIHLTPLPPVSIGWFVGPGHFDLPCPAGIEDLAAVPIVSFSKTTIPHRQVVELLTPGRKQPVIVHGSTSLATVVHLVGQGFGIGTIPHDIVAAWPGADIREIPVLPEAKLPDLEFALCYMPDKNEEIGAAVAKAAIEAAND